MLRLPTRARLELLVQREIGRLVAILWIPAMAFALRFGLGYRIRNARALRARYRSLVRESEGPVLICANHLTMIDSMLVAWALGGSWWWVFNYRRMPWNLPEYTKFAHHWFNRALAWIAKCIPIIRGGKRTHVSGVLRRIQHLLVRGETALIFAEGGRSRTGRVQLDSITDGVGRIMNTVRGCQALCVYLRGDRQRTWSTFPARGDSFYVDFELFRPRSDYSGLRRSRDFARQILEQLAAMEERYFAQAGAVA